MKLFDTDPIDLPPVSITRLADDDEGQALIEKLQDLRDQREQADAKAREVRRPLSDLMAEADELAARSMVGDVDPEEADEAEAKVRKTKDRIEELRRKVKQFDRAAVLVEEKLDERAEDLYDDNAEAVRSVHRLLTRHALEAERRASALLRLLREFEVRYARYAAGPEAKSHPQYLPDHLRTQPPRSLMGPARTSGGNVFDRSDATTWMRRAADLLDAEPPAVIDLSSIDFESEVAAIETVDPDDLDPPADALSPSTPETDDHTPDDDPPEEADPKPDDPTAGASADNQESGNEESGGEEPGGENAGGEDADDTEEPDEEPAKV
jgi:hypothetical protein